MATTAKGQQRLEILGCGAYTKEKGGKAQKRVRVRVRVTELVEPVLVL